jgi:hypothetical protein
MYAFSHPSIHSYIEPSIPTFTQQPNYPSIYSCIYPFLLQPRRCLHSSCFSTKCKFCASDFTIVSPDRTIQMSGPPSGANNNSHDVLLTRKAPSQWRPIESATLACPQTENRHHTPYGHWGRLIQAYLLFEKNVLFTLDLAVWFQIIFWGTISTQTAYKTEARSYSPLHTRKPADVSTLYL